MLNCIISYKLRKPPFQLLRTSLCSCCRKKNLSWFSVLKYFAKEQMLVSEDFNVDFVYHKLLLILDKL